jgi:hypothetical protein
MAVVRRFPGIGMIQIPQSPLARLKSPLIGGFCSSGDTKSIK